MRHLKSAAGRAGGLLSRISSPLATRTVLPGLELLTGSSLLLTLLSTLADGCPTPSFGPPIAFGPKTNYPMDAAIGDFNRDGKPDLVVPNWSIPGNVFVMLGNGDGTFGPGVSSGAGNRPVHLAVGDLNGDGKLDLAVTTEAASSAGTVSMLLVLLGNGDGSFQTPVSYDTGGSAESVAVGDFNGDAKLDLAVANSGYGALKGVAVLLGNGDGTFKTAVNYTAGGGPWGVAVGDFNGDGKPDLTVANTDGSLSVLLGNGDGTFRAAVNYPTGSSSVSVAVGDFNGDSKLDLAVANNGSFQTNFTDASVSVLLGNGDGSFQPAVNYHTGTASASVAVGDFNGDGKPDLTVANSGSGQNGFTDGGVSVLLGNGDGTFQPAANYAAGWVPSSVAVGEFNGDGAPDLVVANIGHFATVSILMNSCVPTGPALSIVTSNSTVTVSWPFPSTGFALESATSLSPPNWQPAVETASTNNNLLLVTVRAERWERYFRLRKP